MTKTVMLASAVLLLGVVPGCRSTNRLIGRNDGAGQCATGKSPDGQYAGNCRDGKDAGDCRDGKNAGRGRDGRNSAECEDGRGATARFFGFGNGPIRWTKAWFEQRSSAPVGARQKYAHGKYWPPYPRPTGEDQSYWQKFHSAHYWPHPYVCYDRAYVSMVCDAQVANGWIAECTLYSYHFDPATNELTQPGQLHLRWILEHAPPIHRATWVQSGATADVSHARLASVKSAATEMLNGTDVPPILLQIASPTGRPAKEINTIRLKEIESMLDPRIKYESVPTGTENEGT